MMRRLSSFAAVALLTFTACNSGAAPTPTPTPTATAAPEPTATPAPETVTTSVVDAAGTDEFFVHIPAAWITITARDITDEASFAAWRAAHPEVPQDAAAAVAQDMSTGGVSLFAFDAESAIGGFTPNLNGAWIDAPVRDLEPWLAEQAATVTSGYGLVSPLEYKAWTLGGEGALDGFVGFYRYSMNGTALAGSQMIVPAPDGRALLLTFTCRDDQTGHFGPIVEALFMSLSARP
jgi:hypothetical protein